MDAFIHRTSIKTPRSGLPPRPKGFHRGVTLYASEDIHGYVSPSEKGVIVPKGTKGKAESGGQRTLNVLFANGERVLCSYDMVTLQKPAEVSLPQPVFTIGQRVEHTMFRPDGTPVSSGWKPYTVVDMDDTRLKIDLGNNDLWVPKSECRPIPLTTASVSVSPTPTCSDCGKAKPLVEGESLCLECLTRLVYCKQCGRERTKAEVDLERCFACEREQEHYQRIKEAGWEEVRASGLALNDVVRINWQSNTGMLPPTYATIQQFSQENPARVLVEEHTREKARFWIAINALTRMTGQMGIVPLGERRTLIEATFKKSLTVTPQPVPRILPKPQPIRIDPTPKPLPAQLPVIGLPPAPSLFDLKETVTDPEYAINAADLEWHGDKPELKAALNGLLLDEIVQAEQKPDGRARLLNVDREKAQTLIDTIRRSYPQSQVRLYRNKYGSWRQV